MALTAGAEERHEPRSAGFLAAALTSAALFSASLLVPLLALLAVASPFPLMLQRLKRGGVSAVGAALLAALLLAAAFSGGQAFAFLLVLALPALLIGDALARGRGLLRGCGWAFAVLSLEIGTALFFAGPQMAESLLAPLEAYRSPRFLEEMRATGLPAERVDEWARRFATLHSAIRVVYPAAFLILGALIVLANAALLRAYLARRDPGWLDGGEFEGIRWGLGLVGLFLAGGLAVAFPLVRPAGYNALLFTAFFFGLQGLAVVAFYARRLAGPPLLRAALMVLVLVNPWAPQILALLGLFDNWFDFRKWAEPPPEAGRS